MKPLPLVAALCVLFTLACGGAGPSEPEVVENPTAWMVVTAVEATEADAETAKGRHHDLGLPGLVQVVPTEGLAGFEPGQFAVAAAIADTAEDGKRLADGYRAAIDTTELRPTITNPQFIDCSEARPDPRCRVGDGTWRALVAFHTQPDQASEDWSHFSESIVRFSANSGVSATYADPDATVVPVSYLGEPVAEVDLKPFLAQGQGYVVAKKGAEPVFIAHGMVSGVLSEAESYLELNILEPIEME